MRKGPKRHDHVTWMLWPKEPIQEGDIAKCAGCKQRWRWSERGWVPLKD